MNKRVSFIIKHKLANDLLLRNIEEMSDVDFAKIICTELIIDNKITKFKEIKEELTINDEVKEHVSNLLYSLHTPMSFNMFKLWEESIIEKFYNIDNFSKFQVLFDRIAKKGGGKIIDYLYMNNQERIPNDWFVYSALEKGVESIVKKGITKSNLITEYKINIGTTESETIFKYNKNIFESVLISNNKSLIAYVFDNYYKDIDLINMEEDLSPEKLIKSSISKNNTIAIDYLLKDFKEKEKVINFLQMPSKYNRFFFSSTQKDYSKIINYLNTEYGVEDKISIYEYLLDLYKNYNYDNFNNFFKLNNLDSEYKSKLTRVIKINQNFNLTFLEVIPFEIEDEINVLNQLFGEINEITPELEKFLMNKIKNKDVIEEVYKLYPQVSVSVNILTKKLLLNLSLEGKEHVRKPQNKI